MPPTDVLTTILELVCASLLSLVLFAIWPPAALLPWAGLAAAMAWSRR